MGGELSSGGKCHHAVKRAESGWWVGLALLLVAVAPWAMGFHCAASCLAHCSRGKGCCWLCCPPWRGALGSPAEMGKRHFRKSFGGQDRLDKGDVFYSGWRGQQSCDQQLGKEAETVGLR